METGTRARSGQGHGRRAAFGGTNLMRQQSNTREKSEEISSQLLSGTNP